MQRIFFLAVCSIFLPFHVSANTIVNNNFDSNSWGPMSKGSYWTLQQSGGVGNSKAARLEYSVAGTANKALSIGVSAYKSNQYWIEMDVKMLGNVSGGSKFVKLFGSGSGSLGNNMTLGIEYNSNVQKEISYHGDTRCTARLNGSTAGPCNPSFKHSSSSIDMRGGTWGHYKAWIKRADPGSKNGEVKIWWNGNLKTHVTNMDSNPTGSSPYFERIEFGGYNHKTAFSGATWYLWVDNVYIGTTDKGGSSSYEPPKTANSPKSPMDFKEN